MVYKQFIICSAVCFNDGEIYKDTPTNIKSGFVICGRRHHNCLTTLEIMGKDISNIKRNEIGFLTNDNLYVTRAEAFIIAKNANQLLNPNLYNDNDVHVLTSECIFQLLDYEM